MKNWQTFALNFCRPGNHICDLIWKTDHVVPFGISRSTILNIEAYNWNSLLASVL